MESKRNFKQRIDEQFLVRELEDIAASAHGPVRERAFDPRVPSRGGRQHAMTSGRFEGPDGGDRRGRDVQQHRRVKPWLHYESLRGTTYPSDGQGPSWRDLTHNEAQRMQEMYMRKRMLQRKLLWLKNEDLPNPQKDAKMAMRRRKDQEAATAESNDMYPVPFFDVLPNSEKLKKMDEKARMIEMESRFRNRIREEKLKNAKLLKSRAPHIGEVITDPIERHVQKRSGTSAVKDVHRLGTDYDHGFGPNPLGVHAWRGNQHRSDPSQATPTNPRDCVQFDLRSRPSVGGAATADPGAENPLAVGAEM